MPLAQVLYPSPTPQGFEEWAFNHWQHHLSIIRAAASVKGVQLAQNNIYPVIQSRFEDFLEQHQVMHNDMNGLLGLQGQDLSSVDFRKKREADNFFFVNFSEHRAVSIALGLGT